MQGLVRERRNVEDTLLRLHRDYGHADDENRKDQQERVTVVSSPEHKRRVQVTLYMPKSTKAFRDKDVRTNIT